MNKALPSVALPYGRHRMPMVKSAKRQTAVKKGNSASSKRSFVQLDISFEKTASLPRKRKLITTVVRRGRKGEARQPRDQKRSRTSDQYVPGPRNWCEESYVKHHHYTGDHSYQGRRLAH